MQTNELKALLQRVQQEVEATPTLAPDLKAQLAELDAAIHQALLRPADGTASDDQPDLEEQALALEAKLAADHPVLVGSVSDAELDANPQLVKSMSVQPPRGSGVVRTIRIGEGAGALIDLQPCGGTHVANTAEIGAVVVTKIEKKSAHTRRVVLGFGANSE